MSLNLKDVLKIIDNLPVSAFKDVQSSYAIRDAIQNGQLNWMRSDEAAIDEKKEQQRCEDRAARDLARFTKRHANVMKLLTEGKLVKGMFIKVTGARDGHGIREFLEEKHGRLVCRQWRPLRRVTGISPGNKCVNDEAGHNVWLKADDYITTHDFGRVAKILTPSILG